MPWFHYTVRQPRPLCPRENRHSRRETAWNGSGMYLCSTLAVISAMPDPPSLRPPPLPPSCWRTIPDLRPDGQPFGATRRQIPDPARGSPAYPRTSSPLPATAPMIQFQCEQSTISTVSAVVCRVQEVRTLRAAGRGGAGNHTACPAARRRCTHAWRRNLRWTSSGLWRGQSVRDSTSSVASSILACQPVRSLRLIAALILL